MYLSTFPDSMPPVWWAGRWWPTGGSHRHRWATSGPPEVCYLGYFILTIQSSFREKIRYLTGFYHRLHHFVTSLTRYIWYVVYLNCPSPLYLLVMFQCQEQNAHVDESLFPHTYNPNLSLVSTYSNFIIVLTAAT